MKFTKVFLRQAHYENSVFEEIVDQQRWVTEFRIVFEHKGKYYEIFVERGSTEHQDDHDPFECMDDEVECPEVEYKTVTLQQWVPVA